MQISNLIITSTNFYISYNTDFISGIEPVANLKQAAALIPNPNPEPEVGMHWTAEKVPFDILKEVLGTIAKFPKNETTYILYRNSNTKEYKFFVPTQECSPALVHYDCTLDKDAPEHPWSYVGQIHTHPEMPAFFSPTDMNKVNDHPGFQVVFGLRNGKVAKTICAIVGPTTFRECDLDEVFSLSEPLDGDYEPRNDWVDKLNTCVANSSKHMYTGTITIPRAEFYKLCSKAGVNPFDNNYIGDSEYSYQQTREYQTNGYRTSGESVRGIAIESDYSRVYDTEDYYEPLYWDSDMPVYSTDDDSEITGS